MGAGPWQARAWHRCHRHPRQGPCRGPSKGLAVMSESSPVSMLPEVLCASLARILPWFCCLLFLLCLRMPLVFTKIDMPPQECVPSPGLNEVGELGSRVARLAGLGLGKLPRQDSCRGCGSCPVKTLARENHLVLLVFWSWRCADCFCGSGPLPCPA